MNPTQYCSDAARTVSDKFYSGNVPVDYFLETLLDFSDVAQELDDIKKSLFYGRSNLNIMNEEGCSHVATIVKPDAIHGIVGIATEGGELVESVIKSMVNNKEIDLVNLSEEIGDVLWYIALLCNTFGLSIENIMQQNIDKLKLRFPEKFTEENANKRNLESERQLLEQTTND